MSKDRDAKLLELYEQNEQLQLQIGQLNREKVLLARNLKYCRDAIRGGTSLKTVPDLIRTMRDRIFPISQPDDYAYLRASDEYIAMLEAAENHAHHALVETKTI